jgi:hypothetical protein
VSDETVAIRLLDTAETLRSCSEDIFSYQTKKLSGNFRVCSIHVALPAMQRLFELAQSLYKYFRYRVAINE